MQDGVDLVERQPVLDLAPVALKERAHIALVKADERVIRPAIVCLREVQRRLVVRDRHQGFDAVLAAFIEEAVVECQPLLVRLRIVAIRIDAAPGN